MKLRGQVKLDIYRPDGVLKETTGWLKNKITSAGLPVVAGLIGNVDSQTAFTYLAVGTSSGVETSGSTTLGTAVITHGLHPSTATITRETSSVASDTLQLYKVWTASGGSSDTIEEIGVFNGPTPGTATMLARKLTTSKVVASGETLTATYKIQVIGD